MALLWHCDICGIPTQLYPESEQEFEEIIQEIETPDPKDPKNKTIKKKIVQRKPLTETIRKQNTISGKLEVHEIPKTRKMKPETVVVNLRMGMEGIQKDFCKKCYEKQIKSPVENLFKVLSKIESK